jgi:hypothetical protein
LSSQPTHVGHRAPAIFSAKYSFFRRIEHETIFSTGLGVEARGIIAEPRGRIIESPSNVGIHRRKPGR